MKRAGIVFAAVFLLLFLIDRNRLLFGTNDEGIYLDAANRMLHGERLYADFFGYMSPGVYWVQGVFLRVFGVDMVAGRLPVLLYFSFECAMVYWLTERLASRGAAWFTVFIFSAIQAADLNFLTAQHRWDSGAISLASICLAVHGHFSGSRWPWVLAGALGVTAALFTPSMLLVAGVTLAWLVIDRELRPRVMPFLIGGAVAGIALLGITALSGILIPFIEQMRWLSRNYSTVNVMAYGATIGGYGNLLAGPLSLDLIMRALIVFCLALPAILPVTNLVGWTLALRRIGEPTRRAVIYLLLCSVALVASTYPRPDLMHLAWVAPVAYALGASLFPAALPKWSQATAVVVTMFGATLLLLHLATTLGGESLATPIGEVRVASESAESVKAVLTLVKPGDSAFVHPYKPLLYFLTQAKNPTRYSYLAPGLMTDQDEQSALTDLRRVPPQWVLFLRLTPEEFLRVFPNADRSRIHFPTLESWIDANYSAVTPPLQVAGYSLLRRNPSQ
jgi:4-amino-4-deoxy-L-arabinose transferase-like glycosyltransferase